MFKYCTKHFLYSFATTYLASPKSHITISQITTTAPTVPNFYIYEDFSESRLNLNNKIIHSIAQIDQNAIFRCVMKAALTEKDMDFNINTIKKDAMLDKLANLGVQIKEKLAKTSSTVIVDAQIAEDYLPKGQFSEEQQKVNQILKNKLELEKLFQDGLNLKLSFLLSKNNIFESSQNYTELLKKKSKAVSCNIVENGVKVEDTIYNNGYLLQHIFLKSYKSDGKQIENLEENQVYNIKEIAAILQMIGFKGKLVLENNSHFDQNVSFLQKIFKQVGYSKKQISDFSGDTWYTLI